MPPRARHVTALLTAPAVLMFLSSNLVNAGNLAFNVLFSRWLGPELFGDLAVLLTIKLGILLLFNALQIAVSKGCAGSPAAAGAYWRLNRALFVGLWLALPIVIGLVLAADLPGALNLSGHHLLPLLLLSLPFIAPLSVLRGIALGRQDMRGVILSANAEMGVRLGGAILAWLAGWGMTGIVMAIVISILAGNLPLWRLRPRAYPPPTTRVALGAGLGALLVLQGAQIILLDGDVFIIKAMLDPQTGGFVAGVALFQRIQVFAIFGLASVLIPSVVIAVQRRRSVLQAAGPVAGLYLLVALPLVGLTMALPVPLTRIVLGASYLDAAELLPPSALSAALFTLSYLTSSLLIALEERRGAAVLAMACVVFPGATVLALSFGLPLVVILWLKAGLHGLLAAVLLVRAATVLWARSPAPERPDPSAHLGAGLGAGT